MLIIFHWCFSIFHHCSLFFPIFHNVSLFFSLFFIIFHCYETFCFIIFHCLFSIVSSLFIVVFSLFHHFSLFLLSMFHYFSLFFIAFQLFNVILWALIRLKNTKTDKIKYFRDPGVTLLQIIYLETFHCVDFFRMFHCFCCIFSYLFHWFSRFFIIFHCCSLSFNCLILFFERW